MLVTDCPVLLELFFVPAELAFDFVDDAVERRKYCIGRIYGNKFVVPLGVNSDFDRWLLSMFEIHRYVNGRDSVEKLPYIIYLIGNLLLRSRAEMPMSGGNIDLHRYGLPERMAAGRANFPPAMRKATILPA